MVKKILMYGSIAGALAAMITIYSLYTQNHRIKAENETMKLHYEAQIAILKFPKEKIDENKEKIRIVYKDKKGDDVIIEKIVTKTIMEKEPVILERPSFKQDDIQRWYVSGAYGYSLDGDVGFGVGAGYNLMDLLSTGLRYDTIGQGQRIALEVRVDF